MGRMSLNEYLLNIDEFALPETLKENNADAQRIVYIIEMMPGSNPKSPDMGFGLKKYRFRDMKSATVLEMQYNLSEQLNRFLPELTVNEVLIKPLNEDTLIIAVDIKSGPLVLNATEQDDGTHLIEYL